MKQKPTTEIFVITNLADLKQKKHRYINLMNHKLTTIYFYHTTIETQRKCISLMNQNPATIYFYICVTHNANSKGKQTQKGKYST